MYSRWIQDIMCVGGGGAGAEALAKTILFPAFLFVCELMSKDVLYRWSPLSMAAQPDVLQHNGLAGCEIEMFVWNMAERETGILGSSFSWGWKAF